MGDNLQSAFIWQFRETYPGGKLDLVTRSTKDNTSLAFVNLINIFDKFPKEIIDFEI